MHFSESNLNQFGSTDNRYSFEGINSQGIRYYCNMLLNVQIPSSVFALPVIDNGFTAEESKNVTKTMPCDYL